MSPDSQSSQIPKKSESQAPSAHPSSSKDRKKAPKAPTPPTASADRSGSESDNASMQTVSDEMASLQASFDPKALATERATQLDIIQQIMTEASSSKATLDVDDIPLQEADGEAEGETPVKKKRKLEKKPEVKTKAKPAVQEAASKKKAASEAVNVSSLKDMFKPQEAQGFGFTDMLDSVELEELQEPAPPPALPHPRPIPRAHGPAQTTPAVPPPLKSAPSLLPDPDAPLFFPLCLDDPADAAFVDALGFDAQQRAKLESRSWTTGGGTRFRRLGTADEIQAAHEQKRAKLTEQVKKRHREAARAARRKAQ